MFLGLMIMGVGPVVSFMWLNQLGDLAKSPQTVEMNLGTSSFVAGGKARLWFAAVDMGPMVEISCKGRSHMVELVDEEPSDEVCGIRVSKMELIEKERRGIRSMRAILRVTWDDKKN